MNKHEEKMVDSLKKEKSELIRIIGKIQSERKEEHVRYGKRLDVASNVIRGVLSSVERLEGSSAIVNSLIRDLQLSVSNSGVKEKRRADRERGGIRFDVETGSVYCRERLLGELRPGSRDYHFFAILWGAFPRTVGYVSLATSVLKKLGMIAHSKASDNYCQSVKSAIKEYSEGIAELIDGYATSNGELGYRILSPSRKPSGNKKKNSRKF